MNKNIFIIILSIIALIVWAIFFGKMLKKQMVLPKDNQLKYMSEVGYWHGQIDAIEGRIKVGLIDGKYKWIESPWTSIEPEYRGK